MSEAIFCSFAKISFSHSGVSPVQINIYHSILKTERPK